MTVLGRTDRDVGAGGLAGRPRRAGAGAARRDRGARRRRPATAPPTAPLAPGLVADRRRCSTELFDAQLDSRHLDHAARWLRGQGRRLLHDRLGRPRGQRARRRARCGRPIRRCCTTARAASTSPGPSRCPATTACATCSSGCSPSADEPIAGGRHKVFGHAGLAVIPQTSTIASHLPRAMGVAFAIGRAGRLGVPTRWPADAIAVCSFGDASLNHSTAQGALNAAAYTAHQGMRDAAAASCARTTGWGISVPTPAGWVEASLSRPRRAALRAGRRHRPGRRVRRRRGARRAGARRPAARPSSTCAPCASAATPAPTSSPPTARRRHPRRPGARPAAGDGAACSSPPARRRRPTLVDRYLDGRADGAGRGRSSSPSAPPLRTRRRGGRAARAAPAGRRRRPARPSPPAPTRAGGVLRPAARGRGAADARRVDQPRARRPARRRPPRARVRRGRRRQGRRLRRDPGAAAQGRRRRGSSTPCSTSSRSSGWPSAPACPGCVPIPEIQYLAYLHNAEDQLRGEAASLALLLQRPVPQPARRAHRRLRLPEGLRRPLPQRQRASPCCATSPASSSPRRRTRPTRRRCCARASPPPSPTAR